VVHNLHTFFSTAKKTLPIYATLTFVPMVVLQFVKLFKDPFTLLRKGKRPSMSCNSRCWAKLSMLALSQFLYFRRTLVLEVDGVLGAVLCDVPSRDLHAEEFCE